MEPLCVIGVFAIELEDFSETQPLRIVSQFLHQQNTRLFFFASKLMDLILAGWDQPQADQPKRPG
eukprot:1069511-Pelagomonas_calceolata.AAC.1